jgi:hypothetical protein
MVRSWPTDPADAGKLAYCLLVLVENKLKALRLAMTVVGTKVSSVKLLVPAVLALPAASVATALTLTVP